MVKKGDYVAFTTKSGKVIKGEYDGTHVLVGKKKHRPPKSQLRKATRPKPKDIFQPSKTTELMKAHASRTKAVKNPENARIQFKKSIIRDPTGKLETLLRKMKSAAVPTSALPVLKIQISVVEEVLKERKTPKPKKETPKPTMVEIKIGDKESMKKGVKKLTDTFLSKAERDLDAIHKEFTLAKARKELKKSKVDFVKFLDRSNEAGEKLNSIIETLNKGIKADTISNAESSSLGSKIKKHQTARKRIMGELQKAFDSKEEFEKTLKEAGIKTLKRQ
jgi:hypothetical protein